MDARDPIRPHKAFVPRGAGCAATIPHPSSSDSELTSATYLLTRDVLTLESIQTRLILAQFLRLGLIFAVLRLRPAL